ncbi:MAG TPA: MBL fold metallo-hydrolase [Dehalococcoidia bacterium]|nr:MBL fold metallo-hydrolase [Dehalococcoidia bacterium]
MPRVKVGNVEIISIVDVEGGFPAAMMYPETTAEQWAPYHTIYPHIPDGDKLKLAVSVFAVIGGGHTVLVDTGLGPKTDPTAPGQLANNLRASGIELDAVDTVIHTHLHVDHVGWNLQDGKPTFPNARHVAPQIDWDYFAKQDDAAFKNQVQPLFDMGRLDLVSGEASFTPELTALPTPGHSPGHQSILVVSGGERALITGDIAHHPAQLQEMDWPVFFDVDTKAAAVTRHKVFADMERDGTLAAFCHFPAPGFGVIVQEGGRRVFRAR